LKEPIHSQLRLALSRPVPAQQTIDGSNHEINEPDRSTRRVSSRLDEMETITGSA
jgi:hypothetical protein